MNYFYEVCTRYGIAGYYTTLEHVNDLFTSRYTGTKYVLKKYKYNDEVGGGRVWTFFYQDASTASAFSSNNYNEVLNVYSQFAEIGLVSGDNILNSYRLNEIPSDIQLILDSLKYQDEEATNAEATDAEATNAEATEQDTNEDAGAEAVDNVNVNVTEAATEAATVDNAGVEDTNRGEAGAVAANDSNEEQAALTNSQIIELTDALDLSEQFS